MTKPTKQTIEAAKAFALDGSNQPQHIEAGRKYLSYLIEVRIKGGKTGGKPLIENPTKETLYMRKYRADQKKNLAK